MDCPQIDLYEFLTEAELQHYYNAVKDELKITNASQFKYATDEDLKSIGMSRPEIRRLRKFYDKYFPHGYLSKIKRLLHAPTSMVKKDEMTGSITSTTAGSPSGSLSGTATGNATKGNSSPNKAPNNKHIIPADAISVNKQLGTGEFGIVQQGVWTNGSERIQVAIKCLCRERMQSNPMEFLKEAAIMHSIEHENIVRLYGVVLATDSLMLVTELAHLRSLLECLKDPGLRVSFLTVPTLCEFGLQICNGMKYLENKRLIHRDLAARNILVFSKNKVKISDFGLSRALGVGKDYYKTNFNVNLKLPIAWCAPECINYLRFTNASDVWAFGVCLWEMFSYGFQPWAALTGLQILEAIDAPNYQRLEQPECCPREYYTLMMKCWQDDPCKRPKFSEIYELLPDMKPEQLKAVANCLEAKTNEHLIYRQNDIITVLDRNTGTPYWKGVLNTGKTGFFNPSNTVAYVEGLPTLNRDSFSRNANERCSKRKLRTEMISKPQNDFKHTGHVGIDGASFGDIAFLGTTQNYNHVPRQIVTPYKPSEDIEQTPLLLPPTPTSPDSLQTASGYFADDLANSTMNPSFVPSTENTPKHFANNGQTAATFEFPTHNTNPFTHKTLEDNIMALQNHNYGLDNGKDNLLWRHSSITNGSGGAAASGGVTFEEPHEYHEISDDDEITPDKLDFGPSLLDEINSMFGSMSATASSSKNSESESQNATTKQRSDFSELTSKLIRKNSAGTTSKKSKNSCGTLKQISVKDEKILNHAIEIANEFSARSMCDLVSDPTPSTQSPKRKFSFRFPHISGHGGSDKSHGSALSIAGGNGGTSTHMNSLSPHSKKKNFSEELKSIPDLQSFHSISSDINTVAVSSADIRIPLFDKETSDFCFEKSREILTRPLQFGSRTCFTAPTPPPSLEYTDDINQSPRKDKKTLSENLMDIENTLKALNLDFMHTFTEVDKNDSDETILNDQFSSIVSSLDDEISSATGSLKSGTVYNYQNGKHTTTTTFDFNAATNHLDKHLQMMSSQATKNSSNSMDKRSSTPDTGFASRDTISLSRRSSQKSSYSPQDTYFSPKDLNFPPTSCAAGTYANFKSDIFKYSDDMISPLRSINAVHKTSNTSIYSPNQLRINEAHNNDTYNGNQEQRQRSMSFTDNLNRDSNMTDKRNGKFPKNLKLPEDVVAQKPKAMSNKSRSARARTLRRLSYNPMPQVATSSSSTDDDDSDRSMDHSLARSECDIRSRGSGTLYHRRRRTNFNRKLFATSGRDDHEVEIHSERQSKIYGSNASIKSAPHYNYPRPTRNSSLGTASQRPHKLNPYDESYPYKERIYDFGAPTLKIKSYNAQMIPKPHKTFQVSAVATNSGSGSSSASSAAASTFSRSVVGNSSVYQEFDVTRLTGRSPTSNIGDLEPNNSTSHLEFQWPEKIHASTVKQNELLWRQQQQIPEFNARNSYRSNSNKDHPSSTLSSSTTDSDQFEYRMGYNNSHLPPSPAP